MAEKRTSDRVDLDVYLNKFIKGVPFMARAKDISREGIYLTQLIEPEAADTVVAVQFQLPGTRDVIYAEGKIVRDVDNAGHGIHFTLITDYHRKLIDRYISRHAYVAKQTRGTVGKRLQPPPLPSRRKRAQTKTALA